MLGAYSLGGIITIHLKVTRRLAEPTDTKPPEKRMFKQTEAGNKTLNQPARHVTFSIPFSNS